MAVPLPLLYVALCLFSPQMTSSSSPTDSSAGNHSSPFLTVSDNEMRLLNHFKVAYSYRSHGQLTVKFNDATTSSISVKWELSSKTSNDSIIESTVLCETVSGIIISKKTVSSMGSYRIEGLASDSTYIICVYLLERSTPSNLTILHFSCHSASTIPMLRSDSIIGVILTLGYIFLMAAIGYFMWKKRSRELHEDKIRINVDELEDEDEYDHLDPTFHASPARTATFASAPSKGSGDRRNQIIGAVNPAVEAAGNARIDGSDVGETNGCLDFRKSRDSASLMCGSTNNTEMEDRRKSANCRSADSSPVKVTEITF